MPKKILYINPAYVPPEIEAEMGKALNQVKSPLTSQVDVASLDKNAPRHLEPYLYEALIAKDTLKIVKDAENNGYDAAIIGCFYDPFLDAAREICERMVVVAPAEACMHLAATLGSTFSIVVGRDKWIPHMRENVVKYGFTEKLASFASLGLGVLEFQEDKARTEQRMRDAVKKAVAEDQAEAIILGCTMEFGFFRELQKEFKVPVIDACLAPLKYAEYLIEVRDVCGWGASKIAGWETPKKGELASWGIEEHYGIKGI